MLVGVTALHEKLSDVGEGPGHHPARKRTEPNQHAVRFVGGCLFWTPAANCSFESRCGSTSGPNKAIPAALSARSTNLLLPSLPGSIPSIPPAGGWSTLVTLTGRQSGQDTRATKKRKLRLPRRCAVKECADCWMHMVQTIDFPVQCITCSCLTCQTPLPGPENLAMSWVSLFNIS